MSLPSTMFMNGHLGGYMQGGDPASWCPNLWQWAVQKLRVQSVLDVGCGEGHSTRAFRELGCQILGIDGCLQAIQDSVVPEHVAQHDFTQGAFAAPQPFDMVWCCEFVEHVDEAYVANILQTFAQAAKVILLTHGLPNQIGHHHVNCQPNSYWIERIERCGFRCDAELTKQARIVTLQDHDHLNYFARSGLVFVKPPVLKSPSILHWFSCKMKSWRIDREFRRSPEFHARKLQRRALKKSR